MRHEFLKGYLFALISEGQLKGTPGQMAKKAAAMFAQDLPAVLTEMAQLAVAQGSNRIAEAVLGKMDQIAKDIGKRGFGAVWADLQAQYKRGMDAKHGPR